MRRIVVDIESRSETAMKIRSIWIPASLSLAVATPALSQDAPDGQRDRRGPPPVAIEACSAAVEGDACLFEGRRGEALEGMCVVSREEVLACRPDGRPPHPRQGGESKGQAEDSID